MQNKEQTLERIISIALNPAIDRVLEVPDLALGAHQVARLLTRYPGGKAVNLAKGLALLDVPCVLTGLVGQAEFDYFAQDLARYRVEMAMQPIAGTTRENITLVDPVARHETHLRDRGFVVSPVEHDALRDRLASLAGPGTVFAFSGSLPQGISPTNFADLLAICTRAGGLLAIDASGPALAAAVDARPWLIKPNQLELEELVGRPLPHRNDLLAAGRDLAGRIPLALVSLGAEGVCLFAGNLAWHARCHVAPDRVASTVGCGDALLAGFLAGIYKNMEYDAALRLAVAVAAAAAMSLTPQFDPRQVDDLLARVEMGQLR